MASHYVSSTMAAAIGDVPQSGRGRARPAPPAPLLCIASSRSAAVRLAPVAAELAANGRLAEHETWPLPPPTERLDGRPPEALAADVERALDRDRPDMALVAGDGHATVLAALAATRRGIPLARLGAGMRCGDRGTADEVNRIVLDALADRLYVEDDEATRILLDEGVPAARIVSVGNTVADVVERLREPAVRRARWAQLGLHPGRYVLVMLHRAENLADGERAWRLTEGLTALAGRMRLVLCLLPKTRAALGTAGVERLAAAGAAICGPLPYLEFLSLEAAAGAVVTDSSTVQDETTALGVRCFTLRRASERTATLTFGTNLLLGEDPESLRQVTLGPARRGTAPLDGWDGAAGLRVAADLLAPRSR